MVLLDSNVLMDYFRSRESDLAKQIDSMEIALCGVVRTELLQGARSEDEIDEYLKAFRTFDNLPNDEYDWEGTGFLLQTLRQNGLRVPLADALIAFTAIKYDVPLWTRDQHFKFIQRLYPELSLYEG